MSTTIEYITLDQLKEWPDQYKGHKWSIFEGFTESRALERVRTYGEPVAVVRGPYSIGVAYIPEAQ